MGKTVLILILLVCFGVQVREGVYKFVKGQTTIAATTTYLTEFKLPVLSFCPGYRHDGYFSEMETFEAFLNSSQGTQV